MAHGKSPKSNQRALLPANVAGIVRELHQLAASANVTDGTGKARESDGRSLVIRGK